MNPDRELIELCSAACEDNLTEEQFQRLERRLAGDPQARRYYIEWAQLQVILERAHICDTSAVIEPKPGFKPRLQAQWILTLAACFVALAGLLTYFSWRPVVDLESVHGEVFVMRGAKVFAAKDHLALSPGDVVQTAPGASARVQWRNEETRLELHANTETRLSTVKDGKHLALLSGTLIAQAAKQEAGHPMILKTPQGRVEVLGTRFELSVAMNTTRVEVSRGRVLITSDEECSGCVVETCQSGEVDASGKVEVTALPAYETVDMGLLAHWPLADGKGNVARDVSGNGLDATIENPVWTTDAGAGALVFSPELKQNMLPEHGSCLQTPELHLPPVFSVSLWLWMDRADSAGRVLQAVFCNSHFGDDSNGFSLFVNCPSQQLTGRPSWNDQTLAFRVGDGRQRTGIHSRPLALTSGGWRFLVVKVNQREGRAEIYLDGQKVCERSSIGKNFSLASPLFFGAAPGQPGLPFFGKMRDIRIYERLLAEGEVKLLARP